MLHKIRHRKLVPALLSALIVLSIWSNAVAAVFCPRMMGISDCCLMQTSHAHSHERASDSGASMARDQTDHMQMADMDTHDMPMEMAGMQMSDMQTDDATASPPESDIESLSNLGLESTPNTGLSNRAITQPNEPCSHCMMHSQSGASFPVSIAGQSNPSYQVVVADTASPMLKSVSPSLTFVELHDHGPPGSSAPLYVLISAFRI